MEQLVYAMESFAVEASKASIAPDSEGYYDFPLAVMDHPSANGAIYDTKEFTREISDPKAYFVDRVTKGWAYGEYKHPRRDAPAARIQKIEEDRISHHFKSVFTKQDDKGRTVVFGKVKPHGPFGAQLQDSLDTPSINTAFSLRAFCKYYNKDGQTRGKLLRLITFDNVIASGFFEASKQRAFEAEQPVVIDTEDYIRAAIHASADQANNEGVALQSLVENDYVLKEFGVDAIGIKDVCSGIIDPKTGRFYPDEKSRPQSAAHLLMRLR